MINRIRLKVAGNFRQKPSAHGIRNRASRPITLSGTETGNSIIEMKNRVKMTPFWCTGVKVTLLFAVFGVKVTLVFAVFEIKRTQKFETS